MNNVATRHGKQFTNAELQQLRRLWQKWQGTEDFVARIAGEMGRTPDAIRCKAATLGLRSQSDGCAKMTLRQVSAALGRNDTSVLHWVQSGQMEPYVQPHQQRAFYAIGIDELWVWMEDMRSWHLWEVDDLADLAWREHFAQVRKGWMRGDEAARVLQIERVAVTKLYEQGILPGRKLVNRAVWFRADEVTRYLHRQTPDTEALVERLAARVARLEMAVERAGLLAVGYPVRARYATQEANR